MTRRATTALGTTFSLFLAMGAGVAGCGAGRTGGVRPETAAVPVSTQASGGDAAAADGRAIHGAWRGTGPCDGSLELRADGTFTRQHFSPGDNRLAGSWAVRWDDEPPTLVLTCESSDEPAHVGRAVEVKIVRLDGEALVYEHETGGGLTRYARADAARP
jgi:hypothetical protein